MPQDYAKNAIHKWSKKKFVSQYKNWIILCSIIALAFIFFRYSSIDFTQIKQKVAHTIKQNQNRPTKLPKPKFEFYTRLPKGNVTEYHAKTAHNKPHSPTKSPRSIDPIEKKLPPKQVINSGQHYLIQVAAFKQLADADKLRAELIMQGFNSNLSHYKNATTTWYRVEIGPFPSLALAKQQQQTL